MSSEYPSFFTSEEMSLVQIYIPSETAHSTISELAELGVVQIKDLNPSVSSFQRPFTPRLRRLAEAARRLRLFEGQIKSLSPPLGIPPLSAIPPFPTVGPRAQNAYDELEERLKEHEKKLSDINRSFEELSKRRGELEEKSSVLKETAGFFNEAEHRHTEIRTSFDDGDGTQPLLEHAAEYGTLPGDSGLSGFDLEFVSGTIERTRMPTFERILWRILRGNLYMNYAEIEEPFVDATSGKETVKDVFIIFAHGAELLGKIRKVSESMGATLYTIDSSQDKRADALREVSTRLEDTDQVLNNINQTRRVELSKIAENLEAWKDAIRREEEVYKTMNLLSYDQGRKTLVAEAWCPTRDLTNIQLGLRRAMETAGTSVPAILSELRTHQTPPTYFQTNKVTEPFQAMMDAYGIPTYQEISAGTIAVVTFPFLYGLMFSDTFHGFLVLLTGAALIFYEKKLSQKKLDEMLGMLFFGRYNLLLMGIFSMYAGFMYNDFASKSVTIWQSGWEWPEDANGTVAAESTGKVYPFGLDPAWNGAVNSLQFTNSLKMKLAIVIGVLHMTFGICLQVPNHIRFKQRISIYVEFIPQILFLWSIFGYLIVLIIAKWATDWSKSATGPPGLLNLLIGIFLSPGTVDPATQMYPGQAFVQVTLLLIAVACVPVHLLGKPYFLYREHQRVVGQGYRGLTGQENGHPTSDVDEDEEDGVGQAVADEGHEEHPWDFADIMVHQVIHTIEFCLGCISNTASYLRLWALSLAHSQLSDVLWTMTIEKAFLFEGGIVVQSVFIFFMFAMWLALTVFILCCMEGLGSFLHAVRLHWVEFNSKFAMCTGIAFQPLSFAFEDDDADA
ncbi:putative vacuolar-ATPase subunit [Kockovaella imperatae]|uniref:V-type proton ATPase subunit a n=1 Tax=Kockovaella imperatae TaxID=4999 RepID=A0A1Y1URL3_9TREE|nr:putative vacuolar-ATPase subunit [Kockovaella imperatae]ORX40247.1 putative vacuolar-ATPase subunit [Kockovaella imperatae]